MKIQELLDQYKQLINFEDKMQKSNFKFVTMFLKYEKRNKRENWEQGCIEFLEDVIDIHKSKVLTIGTYKI